MPVHTVPVDDLEATILGLERAGVEDVIHITPRGPKFIIVTRKRYPAQYETRGLS